MPEPKDLQIFCCGVVQYSMSSGKFGPDDILPLTKAAMLAFTEVFGMTEVKRYDPPATPRHQYVVPLAGDVPQRVGSAQSVGSVAREVVGQNDVPASDERGFAKWGSWGARCFVFGKNAQCPNFGKPWNEVTWEEFLQMATNEDAQALKALNRMANDELKGGQWEKQNRARIANAKCVLGMARKMKADAEASESMGGDGDSTPF